MSAPGASLIECPCGSRLIVGQHAITDGVLAEHGCHHCGRVGEWHVVAVDVFDYESAWLASEAERIEARCGDYPAPCNCDDPITHNGH
jgi:hypothetical protein